MLKGNVNRMFLTDEVAELVKMYEFAQKRLEKIYEYHYGRLNNNRYVTANKKIPGTIPGIV